MMAVILFVSWVQGTGSAGATIRVYIEQYEPSTEKHSLDAQDALKPLIGQYITVPREL